MEGLPGLYTRDQCSPESKENPLYREGQRLLTNEVNAVARACYQAGATDITASDGHGARFRFGAPNWITGELDPLVRPATGLREFFEEEETDALLIIGQHAMAGTLNGFLDHTGISKKICRFMVNGIEHGEPGYAALYAGAFGVPLIYLSGDEAACAEARRMFCPIVTTPTKRGTGWATCELYPIEEVRAQMEIDVREALGNIGQARPYRLEEPLEVTIEYAWTELADRVASYPNVRRPHPRMASWRIASARDILKRPGPNWSPPDL